jgi:hypothetical protein
MFDPLQIPHVFRARSVRPSKRGVLTTGFDDLDAALMGGWPHPALIGVLVDVYGIGRGAGVRSAFASARVEEQLAIGCLAQPAIHAKRRCAPTNSHSRDELADARAERARRVVGRRAVSTFERQLNCPSVEFGIQHGGLASFKTCGCEHEQRGNHLSAFARCIPAITGECSHRSST